MNNKQESKEFEVTIANFLRLSGYNVTSEMILGHKKIDLYFEEYNIGRTTRIAVECKKYSQVITQAQVNEIYANYLPLYQNNMIDEILIVTLSGLSPSAITMVREIRELTHMTFSELQRAIMDFRPYLLNLSSQFKEYGLSVYYIRLFTEKEGDLENYIFDWINGEDDQPIAIWGSYGLGKPTFALRLSHMLSENSLGDPSKRIPIFIRLGDISSEQSLEGLLGKVLTATSVVKNYNFNTFLELNKMGRFVILLDGFDEMKHTLSWEEFRYNFRQINRLITPKSRVVLFGRPTAFLNDEERLYALHGVRLYNETKIVDHGWPDYREIYLNLFTREHVKEFLLKYFEYIKSLARLPYEKWKLDRIIRDKIDEITSKHFSDITRRPVQLKMIAEVLPKWLEDGEDISNLTLTILYDYFIDLIIEREYDKITRRRFSTSERRNFARNLAFWLWREESEMSISAEEIPLSILLKYADSGEDIESVRRDLVSACFLERKVDGSLYFPHRSFQEFLVAEEIVTMLNSREITLKEAHTLISEEISTFMEGIINLSHLQKWQFSLNNFRGTLPWRFLRIWIAEDRYVNYLLSQMKDSDNPWLALLLSIAVTRDQYSYLYNDLYGLIQKKMKELKDGEYLMICCFCIFLMATKFKKLPLIKDLVLNLIKMKNYDTKLYVGGLFREFVISQKTNTIYMDKIYKYFLEKLNEYCMISEWHHGPIEFIGDKLIRKIKIDSSIMSLLQNSF